MKRICTRYWVMLLVLGMFVSPAFAINVSQPATDERLPDQQAVEAAMREFKSLSKQERKTRIKEAKKLIREFKAAKKSGEPIVSNKFVLALFAILLPPLAVYLHQGAINNRFWIALLLTLLLWLPGVIYALFVVLS